MRRSDADVSFEVQGLGSNETYIPLSQAARVVQLLQQIPVEVTQAGSCRIEASGTRLDIYGVDKGLKDCKITDPSKIKNIAVQNDLVIFTVDCEGFTEIVLHGKQLKATPATSYSSSTRSSGESRSGISTRSCG